MTLIETSMHPAECNPGHILLSQLVVNGSKMWRDQKTTISHKLLRFQLEMVEMVFLEHDPRPPLTLKQLT